MSGIQEAGLVSGQWHRGNARPLVSEFVGSGPWSLRMEKHQGRIWPASSSLMLTFFPLQTHQIILLYYYPNRIMKKYLFQVLCSYSCALSFKYSVHASSRTSLTCSLFHFRAGCKYFQMCTVIRFQLKPIQFSALIIWFSFFIFLFPKVNWECFHIWSFPILSLEDMAGRGRGRNQRMVPYDIKINFCL